MRCSEMNWLQLLHGLRLQDSFGGRRRSERVHGENHATSNGKTEIIAPQNSSLSSPEKKKTHSRAISSPAEGGWHSTTNGTRASILTSTHYTSTTIVVHCMLFYTIVLYSPLKS